MIKDKRKWTLLRIVAFFGALLVCSLAITSGILWWGTNTLAGGSFLYGYRLFLLLPRTYPATYTILEETDTVTFAWKGENRNYDKVLYDDGTNRIKLLSITSAPESDSRRMLFKCSATGKYDAAGGSLVTIFPMDGEFSHSSFFWIELNGTFVPLLHEDSTPYPRSTMPFELSLPDAYAEDLRQSIEKEEQITLKITNLVRTDWAYKP